MNTDPVLHPLPLAVTVIARFVGCGLRGVGLLLVSPRLSRLVRPKTRLGRLAGEAAVDLNGLCQKKGKPGDLEMILKGKKRRFLCYIEK